MTTPARFEPATTPSQPLPGGEPTQDLADDRHLGSALTSLLVSTAPFILVTWNIIQVSDGDHSVALVLMRTLDLPAILFATLSQVAPFLTAALYALILRKSFQHLDPERLSGTFTNAVASAVPVYACLYFPAIYFFMFTVSYAFILYALRKSRSPHARSPRELSNLFVAHVALGGMISFLGAPVMWLPAEVIKTQQNPSGIVAYVLEDGEHDLTILRRNREPTILPRDEVLNRTLCAEKETSAQEFSRLLYSKTVFEIWHGPDDTLPACPEESG